MIDRAPQRPIGAPYSPGLVRRARKVCAANIASPTVGRRAFVSLLGGAISAPRIALAQADLTTIGLLHTAKAESYVANAAGFAQGLKEGGLVEAQNLAIDYRFANGLPEPLPAMAADLVAHRVSLIVAGDGPAALAAKTATSAIPIVFVTGDDPVALGLVASRERPGGNATGAAFTTSGLMADKLKLLRELIPSMTRVGYLGEDPKSYSAYAAQTRAIEALKEEILAAAGRIGWQVVVAEVGAQRDYEAAFAAFAERRAEGVVVAPSPLFANDDEDIAAVAASHEVATIYSGRADVVAGGLMSYGARQSDAWRMAGAYVGKILAGARAAEMPVLNESALELVISRGTARSMNLPGTAALLSRADEVTD